MAPSLAYVAQMRCTFYVDGDVLYPWEEDLMPGPPEHGRVVIRHGHRWIVERVIVSESPDSEREASIWLVLAPERPASE